MDFDDLRLGLVLCAAFADCIAGTKHLNTERARVQFFEKWSALSEDVRCACVLAALVRSPLCQNTDEVRAWRRIRDRADQIETVLTRVN